MTDTLNQSIAGILSINPGMRDSILQYMISIVMSDKRIAEEEVAFLYNFGENLGFCQIEVASAIASAIQHSYVPSLESIC